MMCAIKLLIFLKLEDALQELQMKFEKERHNVLELREELEERTKEVEAIRKKHHRDASVNNGFHDSPSRTPSAPSTPTKHESSAYREEVRGLKYDVFVYLSESIADGHDRHIVQNLQQENHTAAQKIKTLEAENQLLVTESEKLRDVSSVETLRISCN